MLNPFRLIVADPPWEYNDRRETRRDNPEKRPKSGMGANRNYSAGCMKPADLVAMGPLVQAVSTADAYLFLWVTCPLLYGRKKSQADLPREVMEAWGFRYCGVAFQWTKLTKDETHPKPGTGFYIPGNLELCLMGTRPGAKPWHDTHGWKPTQEIRVPHPRWPVGKPPCPRTGRKRSGEIIHSRKPEDAQDRLDRWLRPHAGDAPFLELFATRPRPDAPPWVCLGHELTGTDIRDDLRAMVPAMQETLF